MFVTKEYRALCMTYHVTTNHNIIILSRRIYAVVAIICEALLYAEPSETGRQYSYQMIIIGEQKFKPTKFPKSRGTIPQKILSPKLNVTRDNISRNYAGKVPVNELDCTPNVIIFSCEVLTFPGIGPDNIFCDTSNVINSVDENVGIVLIK